MRGRELLTATQAAAYLGVSRTTVNNMTKWGYGTRVGSVWLFTKAELDEWAQTPRHPGGRPKSVLPTSRRVGATRVA